MPGAMPTTRMPKRASSRASGSTMPWTAAFDVPYATCPTWPSKAATEAVWISRPRSPSASGAFDCMIAAAARSSRKVPSTLMFMTRWKAAVGRGPSLPRSLPGVATPAQATATLSPPMWSAAARTAASTSDSLVTSQCR